MNAARSAPSFLLLVLLLGTPAGFSQISPAPEFVRGELILKFKDDSFNTLREAARSRSRLGDLIRKYAATEMNPLIPRASKLLKSGLANSSTRARRAGIERTQLLKLARDADVIAASREFTGLPEIAYAEPNYIYHVSELPNDFYLASSGAWGQSYRDMWGHFKINAPAAWDTSTGKGIVVGVIDTGCDITHPDLNGNIWTNRAEIPDNGIDDDANGYVDDVHGVNLISPGHPPQDLNGHGTHVAGTIAATGNNGIGIAGVAYEARIMPVEGFDESGSGDAFSLAEGILYAVASGARVLNLSWGGIGTSQAIEDAIELAWSQNIVVVAAAGNNGVDLNLWDEFPAKSRYVISVGASTPSDRLATFSNFGFPIDVVAPGGGDGSESSPDSASLLYNILSLRSATIGDSGLSAPLFRVGQEYMRLAGTSMAAPHVAGLAALILERRPDATPEEVRQLIRLSATDMLDAGWDSRSGYGLINAGQAVVNMASGSARIFKWSFQDNESVSFHVIADAAAFDHYVLEYGPVDQGESQRQWTAIYRSQSPSGLEQALIWNIEEVPDNSYFVRLRVNSTNGVLYSDRVQIKLDRAAFSSPETNIAFRPGTRIQFEGSAAGGHFDSYVLEFLNPATEAWSSEGINLANGGREKVRSGILGEWDSPVLGQTGFYKIRMVLKRKDLEDIVRETQVILDKSLHPGWPIELPKEDPYTGCSTNATAADLDGDGLPEILVGCVSRIFAYHADGTGVAGWPPEVFAPSIILSSPQVGDLDGDGRPEVVSVNLGKSQVFIWRRNGQLAPGWPKTMPVDIRSIRLADMNQDGRDEIIGAGFSGVIVFDINGDILPGWPQWLSEDALPLSSVSVGDTDNDGKNEIIVQVEQDEQLLYLFNSDGKLRQGWPVTLTPGLKDSFEQHQPVMADVNNDGRAEILTLWNSLTEKRFQSLIGVFSADGGVLPGWPKTLGVYSAGTGMADINGDNIPEVLVGSQDNGNFPTLYAWTGSGELLPGWPVQNNLYNGHFNSPVMVDIDGDGIRDVIASSGGSLFNQFRSSPFALAAYRYDGQPVPGFPKPTPFEAWIVEDAPLVMDFNGDGLLELVWLCPGQNFYLMMWDLDGFDWPSPDRRRDGRPHPPRN